MKLTTLRSAGGNEGYAARIRARESIELLEVSDIDEGRSCREESVKNELARLNEKSGERFSTDNYN